VEKTFGKLPSMRLIRRQKDNIMIIRETGSQDGKTLGSNVLVINI
jgi:hypothetical protein